MAKLIDLKRTKKDREKEKEGYNTVCGPGSDDYSYGLRISLDNRDLEKLGIDLPKTGAKVTIEAVCEVTETSSNSRAGKDEQRVTLQIQKLALSKGGESMEDAIDKGVEEADEDA